MANDTQSPATNPASTRQSKEEQNRKKRRRARQLMGFVLTILIVVGAVSIVKFSIEGVKGLLDTSSDYENYNKKIEAFVWYDPIPFEKLDKADWNVLKSACLWGVQNQQVQKGEPLERNDLGETLVPSSMLDRFAVALFGPNFSFSSHASFEDNFMAMTYVYDEKLQVYLIPPTSLLPDYISTVVDIKRESGGVLRVTVGYVSTRGSSDQLIDKPDMENPAKYMDYMFRRDAGEHYLYAIEANTTYVPEKSASASSVAAPSVSQESESSSKLS